MTATEGFLSALKDRNVESKRTCKGWLAKCPAHDDRRASLSIAEGEGGRALVNCHAGCTAEAVCNAVGLRSADLMPDDRGTPSPSAPTVESTAVEKPSNKQNGKSITTSEKAVASLERQLGKPSATWTYLDCKSKAVGLILRWDKPDGAKEFRPITRHPDGWRISGMPEPRPLYGLPELVAAECVYIVEGEKTAEAVRSLGLVATTSSHGSKSAGKTDWSPLAGKKCVIVPDCDDAGRAYANDVAAILAKLTPVAMVQIVELNELPDGSPMPKGGDLADWVDAHGDAAEPEMMAAKLIALVAAATVFPPSTHAWPEIVSFDSLVLPDFPTAALPDVLRQWVEAESHFTQTPADLAALLVLAVCSATIARQVVVEPRTDWIEPVNLYVAVLLEPGNRKSAVFADALKPLREFEAKLIEAARPTVAQAMSERRQAEIKLKKLERLAAEKGDATASYEASVLSEQIALQDEPVLPRLIVDDATNEKLGEILAEQGGRIASMSPEGGVFDLMAGLYSKSGIPQFGVYLQGHSGDDLVTDRISRKSIRVEKPALTCAYAMQPEVIKGLAGNTAFRGRGLLARFLYATPKSWIGTRKIAPPPVPVAVQEAYRAAVLTLAIPGADVVLQLTSDASTALQDWEAEIETMLGDGGELETMRDWGSKLAGATVRLAAVLHSVEHGPTGQISGATLNAAIEIGRFLIPHAETALNMMQASEGSGDADARYVLRWIERHHRAEFTKRDAQQHGKRQFPRADDIGPALAELMRRGYIRLRPAAAAGPGRPPSPAYEVNPAVLAKEAPKSALRIPRIRPHELIAPHSENIENDIEKSENASRVQVTI